MYVSEAQWRHCAFVITYVYRELLTEAVEMKMTEKDYAQVVTNAMHEDVAHELHGYMEPRSQYPREMFTDAPHFVEVMRSVFMDWQRQVLRSSGSLASIGA